MFARFQVDQCAGCRRQPHVALVQTRFTVDHHKVSIAHIAQIHKYGIGSICWSNERSLIERLVLRNLLRPGSGGDFGHFIGTRSSLCLFFKFDNIIGRIKIRQPILMPKQTITLIGIIKGDGNLGIHLSQSTADVSQVELTILKLTQSKQKLIAGGFKTLFSYKTGFTQYGIGG